MYRKNPELHIQRSKPPKTVARPRFKVELEAAHDPTDVDGSRRLRGALKRLLRSFGLRCVRVEPADLGKNGQRSATPDPQSDIHRHETA